MPRSPLQSRAFILATVAGAFYAAARFGLLLNVPSLRVTPVWPAFGVALAAMSHFGLWVWPAVFVGAALGRIDPGVSLLVVLGTAVGSTLEALIACHILRRVESQQKLGEYFPRPLGLFLGSALGALASASLGVALRVHAKMLTPDMAGASWIAWWVSNQLGALAVTPLLIRVAAPRRAGASARRSLASVCMPVLIYTCGLAAVFYAPCPMPVVFVLMPLLLWSTMQVPPGLTELSLLATALVAAVATKIGTGPFSGGSPADNQINVELFLAAFLITGLFLPAIRAAGARRLPTLVLLVGWICAAGVAYIIDDHKRALDDANLRSVAAQVEADIRQRFDFHVQELERGADLLVASGATAVGGPQGVTQSVGSSTGRPWLKGLGYLTAGGAATSPEATGAPPFDMSQPDEGELRGAAAAAQESGRPQMTRTAAARRDGGSDFLLLIPLYAKAMDVTAAANRRAPRAGLIYVVFDLPRFFRSVRSTADVAFTVTDSGVSPRPLYDSESAESAPLPSEGGVAQLTLAHYPLTITSRRGPAFVSHRDFGATGMASVTSLLTLALSLLVVNLQSVSQRASADSRRITGELAEREGLWQALTESAPVGILQMDVTGSCVYANPRMAELTGLPAAAARGQGWLGAVKTEDRQQVKNAWLELLDGRPFHMQFRTAKLGDTDTWVTGMATSTRGEAGQVTGYLATMQDISEIKKQQRDLVASSKMSSLGEMAGGIAHEVNNPLMIIQAMADQLRRACDRGELDHARVRQSALNIEATVYRIAKIVSGLRAFARNADKDPMALSSLGAIVEATLGLCQQRLRATGIEVRVFGDLEATLYCRAVQLSQVLLNMLNNAFDAVERLTPRWIAITAKDLPSAVELTITDSGPGIPEEVAAKIMQPFFTTKPVGKGTGLGLSISKGIVEDHGGSLVLDANGPNTRFVITLPKNSDAAE